MRCEICHKDMSKMNTRGKVLHVRNKHDLSYLDYCIEYENFIIPKCVICGEEAKHMNALEFRQTCGKRECANKASSSPHTDEMKKHLSQKRKEYLNKNKDKHNWSLYHSQETEPERIFREVLETINDIQFYQYYIPKEADRFYELDFSIPELKIDFEVNGQQHYDEEGNLAPYYQERHDYLEDLGWKVIEIHYSLCYNKEKIKEIVSQTLNGNVYFAENMSREVINYRKDKLKKKKENEYNRTYLKIRDAQKEYERFVLIMNIINKHGENMGLISELSDSLGVSHTQVRRILKKYDLDIELRKKAKITRCCRT